MIRILTVKDLDNIEMKQLKMAIEKKIENNLKIYTESELDELIDVVINKKETVKIKRRESIKVYCCVDVLRKQEIEFMERVLNKIDTDTDLSKAIYGRLESEIKYKKRYNRKK